MHILFSLPLLLSTPLLPSLPLAHLLLLLSPLPLSSSSCDSYLPLLPCYLPRYNTMASSSRLQERTGRMPRSPSPLPSPTSGVLHLLCLHESSVLRDLHHASCLLWHYQGVVVAILVLNLMNMIQPSKTAMVKNFVLLIINFVHHP